MCGSIATTFKELDLLCITGDSVGIVGVFPVEVKTIEIVLFNSLDENISPCVAGAGGADQTAKVEGAGPTAEG